MRAALTINHQPSGGKEWVAEVLGRDPQYGVKRKFLVPIGRNWSSSGKTGTTTFELEEGKLYEAKPSWKHKFYVTCRDGKVARPSTAEVQEMLDVLDAEVAG